MSPGDHCCVQVLVAGVVPMFLTGALLAIWRQWSLKRAALKFAGYQTGWRYKDYHK